MTPGRGGRADKGASVRRTRAGALWPRRAALCLVLAAALLLAVLARVVRVEGPPQTSTLWLWAWQTGRVEFINSVTRRPVVISFGLPWRFSGFAARTDPGTEEYYTTGAYVWNERLAGESTRRISYCSEVGVTLTLGERRFRQQSGGCLEASLVWPP